MAAVDETAESVRLQVAAAATQDAGKGTARISHQAMGQLGLSPGDVIEIEGTRRTPAVVLPPYREDEGLEIIRLDGLQRANAGVGIRETITIRAAQPKPAKRVVLAPAANNVRLHGPGEALRRTLMNRPVVSGDVISTSVYQRSPGMDEDTLPEDLLRSFFEQRTYGLQEIRLVVVSTSPSGTVLITNQTEVELRPEFVKPEEPRVAGVTYDDVGGMGEVIDQVREMIELPLKHPELFERLGIDPPTGIILHGPPGTGKTLIARAVAHESDAAFFSINGPEIIGKFHGESEERLRGIFEEAQRDAPSIIFIDELDSIAPKRSEVTSEIERRLVAQLLTLMDGLAPRQNVIVIGATNRLDALDEALRRPGRFDRELVVGVPDTKGREQILHIHTRGMPLAEGVDIPALAATTYGFVGADLSALCREAALEALRLRLPEIDLDAEIPQEVLEDLFVTHDDFINGLKRIQPSALREIVIQIPDVRWDDVGGLDEAKRALREGVELPLRNPEAFQRLGIRPAKGFLLYGPPGTGKTLIAKAVAREAESNFISVRSSDLLSKWYGESEKQIAQLFSRARQVAPAIIFIDEIDSLAPQRGSGFGEPAVTERVVNTILAEMDGLEELQGVVVVAATNQPSLLDTALLRPGRFDELVYVGVPDEDGRRRILEIHSRKMPLAHDVDLNALAKKTQGYTGADLEDLTRRAGLLALRTDPDMARIPMRLFERALEETRASVTPEMERRYKAIAESLMREGPRQPKLGFSNTEGSQ